MMAAFILAGILSACGKSDENSFAETENSVIAESVAETELFSESEMMQETEPQTEADPASDPYYEEKYGYYTALAAEYEAHGYFSSNEKLVTFYVGNNNYSGDNFSYRNGSITFLKSEKIQDEETMSVMTCDLQSKAVTERKIEWWKTHTVMENNYDGKCVAMTPSIGGVDENMQRITLPPVIHVFDLFDETFGYEVHAADLGYIEGTMPSESNFINNIKQYYVLPSGALLIEYDDHYAKNAYTKHNLLYYSPEEGLKEYQLFGLDSQTGEAPYHCLVGAYGDKVYFRLINDYYYLNLTTGNWETLSCPTALSQEAETYGKYMLVRGGSDENSNRQNDILFDLETAQPLDEGMIPVENDTPVYRGGEGHFFDYYRMRAKRPVNGAQIDKHTKEILAEDMNGSCIPLNETYFLYSSSYPLEGYELSPYTWYLGTYENGMSSLEPLYQYGIS